MKNSFLYRVPALSFDIFDSKEVAQNFKQVLECIKVSSLDFYTIIKGKCWETLSEKERKKVFKYLVRGRYRATPFGLWASVGLGMWGDHSFIQSERIEYTPLRIAEEDWICSLEVIRSSFKKDVICKINPSLAYQGGYWFYQCFEPEIGKWSEYFEKGNDFLDFLIRTLQDKTYFDFPSFLKFGLNVPHVDQLWEGLISQGILTVVNTPEPIKSMIMKAKRKEMAGVSFFKGTVQQDVQIKHRLEKVMSEIGGLFDFHPRPVLQKFEQWYSKRFDDLFVPLNNLLCPDLEFSQALTGFSIEMDGKTDYEQGLFQLLRGGGDVVDLSKGINIQALSGNFSITVAYREIERGSILFDNVVCDRPLVYTGRFCHDPSVFGHAKETINHILNDGNAKYAEVIILEESSTQALCHSRKIFDKQIRLDTPLHKEDEVLLLDDLFIGMDRGKWVLVEKKTGERIIPIFPHAVSYGWISHPIGKLLWEIALQDSPKFFLYQNPVVQQMPYVPRIIWGNKVVLAASRWTISDAEVKTIDELEFLILNKKIPRYVVAGKSDLEFHLDLEKYTCKELLFDELKKEGRLQVREWLYKNTPYEDKNGQPIYPQFVVTLPNVNSSPSKISKVLNKSIEKSNGWACWKIYLPLGIIPAFVSEHLYQIMSHEQINSSIESWFYVYYEDNHPHIRLRVKLNDLNSKFVVMGQIFSMVKLKYESARLEELDYMPEFTKYGKYGILISEQIFHLESVLFTIREEFKPGFLDLRYEAQVSWLVEFWKIVIVESEMETAYGDWFTNIWNGIPVSEKRRKSAKWQEHVKFKSSFELEKRIIESNPIKDKLIQHPLVENKGSVQILLHHLHMMCNRIFFDTGKEMEGLIQLGIYREIMSLEFSPRFSR